MLGIAAFSNLDTLICYCNQITELNTSNNTAVKYLLCSNNQLSSLNVSGCNELKGLICSFNMLTSLDVSNNRALYGLHCQWNELTNLYSTKECSGSTKLLEFGRHDVSIYPNPTISNSTSPPSNQESILLRSARRTL